MESSSGFAGPEKQPSITTTSSRSSFSTRINTMKLLSLKYAVAVVTMCQSLLARAYYFQADDAHHTGTLMSWPTKSSVYRKNITRTRQEIAAIVQAIGRHEPVKVFVHDDPDSLKSAREMLRDIQAATIFPTCHVDSLWARDTAPLFVSRSRTDNSTSGVTLNFNEWGKKVPQSADDQFAKAVLRRFDVPAVVANITSEGGALEHDGEGTMMVTESSILNRNRNPGKTKADIEQEFARLFGIRKTIWFKGSYHSDITDAHVDGLARFVSPGLVALTRPSASAPKLALNIYYNAKKVLATATDAKGRRLKVVEVPEPNYNNYPNIFNLCIEYVNWYTVNGAVILAGFQDREADARAKEIVQKLYPNRVIEQVQLYELARQGGGIHCATQQIVGPHIHD